MVRIFITGSSDGLGSLTAKRLISQGHQVVLHARNAQRAADAQAACPGSEACLIGDLTSIQETKKLAADANRLGPRFDCVLHNAAINTRRGNGGGGGGNDLFKVNTLAPYILTCLMAQPKRLVYVSSGMHHSGSPWLENDGVDLERRTEYSDSKLHDIMLAKAFARRLGSESESASRSEGVRHNSNNNTNNNNKEEEEDQDVFESSNAVNPGWVPTKMGGYGAPGDIEKSVTCFAMLCTGQGQAEGKTGVYFQDSKVVSCAEVTDDKMLQDALLKKLAEISGVEVPL